MVGEATVIQGRIRDVDGVADTMPMETRVRPAWVRRTSWGSIIAGTAVSFTCQILLTTLGAAIGLAVINPAAGAENAAGIGVGAGIWWLITGLISLFVGGLVAGRLAGFPSIVESSLHGLLVWALAGFLGAAFITTSAAALVGGAYGPLARDMNASNAATIPATRAPSASQPAVDSPGSERAAADMSGSTDLQPTTRQVKNTIAGAAAWSFFALLLGAGCAALGGGIARPTRAAPV